MWQRSAVWLHAVIQTWFVPSHPSPSVRGLLFYSGSSASSCEIKRQRICGGWWISVTSCHFQQCHRLFCLFSTGQNSVSWSHFAAEALFFKKRREKSWISVFLITYPLLPIHEILKTLLQGSQYKVTST